MAPNKQGLKHLHCTVTDMKMLLSFPDIWQQVGSLIPVELLCHSRFTDVHEVKMVVEWPPHLLPSQEVGYTKEGQSGLGLKGREAEHIPGSSDTQHHFPDQRSRKVPGWLEIVSFWQPRNQNFQCSLPALRTLHSLQWGKAAWFVLRELHPGEKWRIHTWKAYNKPHKNTYTL